MQNGWRGCGRFGFWIIPIQLLAVLLSISSGAIADETNLLANGSFEQVGDSPDQAASWSRWGDWINREDSWTPTHEGKAIVGYHHWQIEKPDDSGMWQDVKVQAGKKYKFTLYVQRDDPATAHGADNIQIALESTEVEPPKAIKITTTPVADLPVGTNWSQLSVEGVATSDAIRVLIRVVPSKDGPRGGAVKFDDASLTIAKS